MPGGFSVVEMYYKTNIIVLVGGGVKPAYPPNQCILWDDRQKKPVGIIELQSNIKAVKLRKN